MLIELSRGLVVILAHRGRFKGAVEALDLAISPGMSGLSKAVFDAVLAADAVEDMPLGVHVVGNIAKPSAIVSQHFMCFIGDGSQPRRKRLAASIFVAWAWSSAQASLLVRSMTKKR